MIFEDILLLKERIIRLKNEKVIKESIISLKKLNIFYFLLTTTFFIILKVILAEEFSKQLTNIDSVFIIPIIFYISCYLGISCAAIDSILTRKKNREKTNKSIIDIEGIINKKQEEYNEKINSFKINDLILLKTKVKNTNSFVKDLIVSDIDFILENKVQE